MQCLAIGRPAHYRHRRHAGAGKQVIAGEDQQTASRGEDGDIFLYESGAKYLPFPGQMANSRRL